MPEFNGKRPGFLPDEAISRMRLYRQERLCTIMKERNIPALLLIDPVNIRYATDARNMQVYALNHDARYVFITSDGHCVLFDWYTGDTYFGGMPIDEVRISRPFGFVANGDHGIEDAIQTWAQEIADLMRTHCAGDLRIGIDRLSPFAAHALKQAGITVMDGQPAIYEARSIKSDDEIAAMRLSMAACDDGFRRMQEQARPGMTEVDVWALLHAANIEWEGEWINARYLTSGPRTNPWGQEASLRVIEKGDIIGCDSDLIGPYGYASDMSRTWIAEGRPTDRQRRLYAESHKHIQRNVELCRAGVSFIELMENNYRLPPEFGEQMFSSYLHGIGLENEWPIVRSVHKKDVAAGYGGGYDGVLHPGMTLCIESYIGEVSGPDGVKLEEQILITEGAPVVLSETPYQEGWL